MRHNVAVLALSAVVVASASAAAGQVIIAAPQATQGPLTAPDGPKPAFEVASVRPNTAPFNALSLSSLLRASPGRFTMSGLPLQMLLTLAFQIRQDQMVGMPDWVRTSRFDINAKMPDGAPQDQMPLMIQSLLEDRFRLKWHTETREGDIYALVVARKDGRLGPKLTKSDMECKAIIEQRQAAMKEAMAKAEASGPQERQAMLEKFLPKPGEPLMCNTSMTPAATAGGPMALTLKAAGMELTNLVSLLTSLSGRPVVDRTGLTGAFDFEFAFSPTMMARGLTTSLPTAPPAAAGLGAPAGGLGAPVPTTDDSPTVFQALEEQLGLRLRPERGPLEYFVVDNIQLPEPD
jgi:uncharacterized protein (TIGR03435 family)